MENNEKAYLERKKILNEYKEKKLQESTTLRVETPQKVLDNALAKDYPRMPEDTRGQLAKMIVTLPTDKKIKIGNKEMDVNSLDVAIADSIEITNCGTTSREEYHEWIESGQKVITDMNTNGVTKDELNERNHLIGDFDQREVEMMTCLALYQRGISNPEVRAKYNTMYNKLQKLREIRSAVRNSTKDVADNFEKEEALKASNNIVEASKNKDSFIYTPSIDEKHVMMATVGALSIYDKLTKDDKKGLDMHHGDDLGNMDFHTYLMHYYVGNIGSAKGFGENKYDSPIMEQHVLDKHTSKEDVAKHILMLSGVKSASKVESNSNRYVRAFDKDRFNMIARNIQNSMGG